MTWRVLVSGTVQGVGFRAYAAQVAKRLGFEGEVWNRTDGQVEALVGGDDARLNEFLDALRFGPGSVASVEATPSELAVQPGFKIGPTR
ncbi:MAG: acylphosphatase [Fimbriimonadaceae bacterium]|nr:MAG: acylphosphatase [Fimbriimonadaceae bacterium]